MHDLKLIRTDPDRLRAALRQRQMQNGDEIVAHVVSLDEERRTTLSEVETFKRERNEASQQVAKLKKSGGNADELITQTR
ncbi:MAG: seryl-tRNA synthetase, partial [Abditibacteriota bacterium]|nr:seryl-tRNA synthetase [Abditibacteriota bacterium]